MKKLLITTMAAVLVGCAQAVAQESKKLTKPDNNSVQMTLTDALWKRHSTWQHSDLPVSDEELGYVLWAASGINRPESGRITAPSAINAQDIVVYVCRAEGTYLYNVAEHSLDRINDKDLRKACCGRDPKPGAAPVILLLVSDLNKFGRGDTPSTRTMASLDAGYVSQNICLMCTALDLNTVPRMTMDAETIKKELGLSDLQLPLLNHPISKPAQTGHGE